MCGIVCSLGFTCSNLHARFTTRCRRRPCFGSQVLECSQTGVYLVQPAIHPATIRQAGPLDMPPIASPNVRDATAPTTRAYHRSRTTTTVLLSCLLLVFPKHLPPKKTHQNPFLYSNHHSILHHNSAFPHVPGLVSS